MFPWQVGEAISDQIVGSVYNSRKTIIVLSSSYLASDWTRMEFMAARSLSRRDRYQVGSTEHVWIAFNGVLLEDCVDSGGGVGSAEPR